MIIACPACATRYVVPDSSIGIDGRTVRCAKCRHSWFQEGPEVELPEPAAPPPQPAPQAAPPENVTPQAPPPPEPAASEPPPAAEPEPPTPEPAVPEAPAPEPETDRAWDRPDAQIETGKTEADGEAPASVPPADEPVPPPPFAQEPVPEPEPETHEPAVQEEEPAEPEAPAEPDAPPLATPATAERESDSSYYVDDDDYPSRFAYEPPFRPRLNRPKLLMIGAVLFALAAVGIGGYISQFGLPAWAKAPVGTFAQAQPDLVLDFPPARQDRRTLPNGTEFFGASGTVTNVGSTERSVPSILIVMRDARDRIVYSWEVVPPKRRLAPGESVTINEAVTDVPKSATAAEIGWKPG